MSKVSSMELDGISNACNTNVMINRPVTSTAASDARNSTVVSRGFSSAGFLLSTISFSLFGKFGIHVEELFISAPSSAHQPESTFPARYLEQMSYRVGKVIKSITHGWRSGQIIVQIARRPVNQKRAPNDIFAGHESPVPAVLAVIAIVTQNKIVVLGNNQLVVFHQFRHFFPPFRIHSIVGRIRPREVVTIEIAERSDVLHIGLVQRNAIDVDTLIDQAQAISRQGDYALHEVLRGIHRIMKD